MARRKPRIDVRAAGNVVAWPPEPRFPAAGSRKLVDHPPLQGQGHSERDRAGRPAGRFDTYRIDCSDEWTRYRWYYSPKLRYPVLIIQTPSSGDSDRGIHMELVSYDPA